MAASVAVAEVEAQLAAVEGVAVAEVDTQLTEPPQLCSMGLVRYAPPLMHAVPCMPGRGVSAFACPACFFT